MNQKLKVGRVDNKRLDRFNIPVHEQRALVFALEGLPACKARLIVDQYVISSVVPQYVDGRAIVNFLGPDIPFHRWLCNCEVYVQLDCERVHDHETMPSLRVGYVNGMTKPELPFEQKITLGDNERVLRYDGTNCQIA